MARFSTVIDATGIDGNVFVVLGTASRFLRELGVPKADRDKMIARVMASGSYDEAVGVIAEWFPVRTAAGLVGATP